MKRLLLILFALYGFISNSHASGVVKGHFSYHHYNYNKYSFTKASYGPANNMSAPLHVEADGESDVLQTLHSFSIKSNSTNHKKLLDCILNQEPLNLSGVGKFSSLRSTTFQTISKRIIIFPFHSFW